ncbi:hypothetical protein Desaci_4070 [Desulfosporosinus acidiphilus SJ4]|uniref:Uncharacterized protein n=1 Tax=Desulfosporosinus acidiphilus (strain DSM 22704 / JCM 16185 / SJ4) TaxID=646529 RepID=I4DAV9_DESAJ|nr:hypothetical protein [Desulfosporosinus acidiphilus]AFM42933.1 hypothetical protein Desaci_4070 [Desulfosporosinus acidiphilus SJ4]
MLIKALNLKVGDQLAEEDGFLWDVTEIIQETETTITVRLNSDFSSFKEHWRSRSGILKTFDKHRSLQGVSA